MSETGPNWETHTAQCPFPDCEWAREYTGPEPELTLEHRREMHYEREHAGRVRVQITLESERLLMGRDPKDVREKLLEDYEPKMGYEIAHVRTEVLQETDDHSQLPDSRRSSGEN